MPGTHDEFLHGSRVPRLQETVCPGQTWSSHGRTTLVSRWSQVRRGEKAQTSGLVGHPDRGENSDMAELGERRQNPKIHHHWNIFRPWVPVLKVHSEGLLNLIGFTMITFTLVTTEFPSTPDCKVAEMTSRYQGIKISPSVSIMK